MTDINRFFRVLLVVIRVLLLCLRRTIVKGMVVSLSGLADCRRSDQEGVKARVMMIMTSA